MLRSGDSNVGDAFLFVFAGALEAHVIELLGLRNASMSNINAEESVHGASVINAARLPFPDRSYDHVIAHAGIHHASRPHQAVCEMYRVARRTVLFLESQDSPLMRLAVRVGLVPVPCPAFSAPVDVRAAADTDTADYDFGRAERRHRCPVAAGIQV